MAAVNDGLGTSTPCILDVISSRLTLSLYQHCYWMICIIIIKLTTYQTSLINWVKCQISLFQHLPRVEQSRSNGIVISQNQFPLGQILSSQATCSYAITLFNIIHLSALEHLMSSGCLWHSKINIASTILLLAGPSGGGLPERKDFFQLAKYYLCTLRTCISHLLDTSSLAPVFLW